MTDLQLLVRSVNIKLQLLYTTFCCKVKTCLGISTAGDTTLYLNQKGEWVSGGTVSGVPTRLAYFDTATSVTGSPLLFWDDAKKGLNINGGLRLSVKNQAYGVNFSLSNQYYHYYFTSGTGTTIVDLSTITEVGYIFVISDLDRISSANNITLDAGVGNTIISTVSAARTLVINANGRSVTLQLTNAIGSYKWMVI
jgi:hypothetical protein